MIAHALSQAPIPSDGTHEAALLPSAYAELKRLAIGHLRHERPGHLLEASALVHEAYLRMAAVPDTGWRDRSHFLATASVVMSRILTDQARQQRSVKRGAGRAALRVEELEIPSDDPRHFQDLGQAMSRLASVAPRPARVVQLRFFWGLTEDEIANHLRVCSRTVKRDWKIAQSWLRGELSRTA